MNNRDLAVCVSRYTELTKIYAGCVTEDDVTLKILPTIENFRQFLITSLLQRNIPSFPFGYMLNTWNSCKWWETLAGGIFRS